MARLLSKFGFLKPFSSILALCSFSAQKTEAQSIELSTVLTQKDKILLLKRQNCQKLRKMALKIKILKFCKTLQKKFSRLINDKVLQIDQTMTGTIKA